MQLKTTTTTPKYAQGFSTLADETTLDDVPVAGRIPEWLTGTLVRTGPAQFEVGHQQYRHWFDGLAMLHRFSLAGNRVSYANCYLRTQSFEEARRTGRISRGEFGTDPCLSVFGRIRSLFSPRVTDNANVNVQRTAEQFVALTETPLPIAFDFDTLRTLGPVELDERLDGQISTAHPHFDFAAGRGFNYQIKLGRASEYLIVSHGSSHPRGEVIGKLPVDKPAYMHSFGMTERFLVLVEFPLVVTPLGLMFSGLLARPFIENYRWCPERGTRFWVLDKSDGRVIRRAEADALFCFHHVNAFERDGEVVVDLSAYDNPAIIEALYLDKLRGGVDLPVGKPRRFRIPTSGGDLVAEPLADTALELPRINYRWCNGREYRFVFGVGTREPSNFIDELVKLDLADGAVRSWRAADCYPGEPVFVPAPDAKSEDEGVVLSLVLDAGAGRSFLLVLDAQTFDEQARAELPHHVPFGFHGQYFRSP